jgi:AraC-like DNA-binding protein
VSFPARFSAIFATALGLRPSDIQAFSVSVARYGKLPRTWNLAHIASEAGYSDQAHLTTDLGRHAGLSPGRFRALARRQIVRDAVRFFKDADLQNRVRLLVCDSGLADDEATDGEIRSEGCKVRGSCPDEFRAPNRNGDVGH